jgi:hypothetical protein
MVIGRYRLRLGWARIAMRRIPLWVLPAHIRVHARVFAAHEAQVLAGHPLLSFLLLQVDLDS